MAAVADEYGRELRAGGVDPPQLQLTLERQAARLPAIDGIRIFDAQGDLRHSSGLQTANAISTADRDFFRELRDNPKSGLLISTPELGRITNKLMVFFARPLAGSDGAFAGEVHGALQVEKLTEIFSTLNVGPHGAVALWNWHGALVARFPQVPQPSGEHAINVRPSSALTRMIEEDRDSGAYHTHSAVDGVTRLFVMRKVGHFPLYLIVALADVDYLGEWRAAASCLAIMSALFLVASIVAGLLIYERSTQARLAASVYENSSEGMAIIDARRSIIDVNRAFTRLTGFPADEARGRNIEHWFSAQRDTELLAVATESLRATGSWAGEVWLKRRADEPFLARVSVNAVEAGNNGRGADYVVLFSDATEQKRAQEKIWLHANFDAVTKLPNRRHFCDSLRGEILEAEATNARTAVIFIDLDRFKDVNDRFGHAVGDELLQLAAERIRSCVRAEDLVARLGGDEFTVMLTKIFDLDEVIPVAERIVAAFARPFAIAGEETFTSASLGVTLHPHDGADVQTLLRNADQAMYAAKQAGRNCFRLFAPQLHVATATHASLASDLHNALANSEIELHYQPIVDMRNGRIVKAEALARWRHPKRGDVPPSEFIPIAEETGLIVEIGDWAFRRAAAQALSWRSAFDPRFQISVNVSAVQFAAPDGAAANFDRLVVRPGLGPGAMIVEITESALVDATETVRGLIARYRRAGIEIALDDFGTGYSSLAYLKDFDISYLKADRAFVSGLTERPRDRAILKAIVVMAHELGIDVIAEGVETEPQRRLLVTAGCDFAQGYLISRPAPAADLEAMLSAQSIRQPTRILAS